MTGTSLQHYNALNETVALFQQGDKKAFSELYDKYAPALLGLIKEIAGNTKKSEEILQKTFMEIWDKRFSFNSGKERLFSWMFRIARVLTIESVSEQENNLVVLNQTGDNFVSSLKALQSEDIYKTAFKLVYFKGCSLNEAAAHLNVPPDILKKKMVNIIKQLRGL